MPEQNDNKSESIEDFRRQVYDYYREHGRTFPWRETDDPYEILVSEFMLQHVCRVYYRDIRRSRRPAA